MMPELGGSDPQQANHTAFSRGDAATGDGQEARSAREAAGEPVAPPGGEANATVTHPYGHTGPTDPKGCRTTRGGRWTRRTTS
jgi:hypothetical protein